MPDLGGMREPGADSRNLGIEPGGFRAYADHMESDAFVRACAACDSSQQRTVGR
jgi:hypothetical protein